MNSPRVVTHGGVTLNLATIKSFHIQNNIKLGKTNVLVFEHKTRFDYILNPNSNEFEKQEYNETTEIEFLSWDLADACRTEWEDIWQDYLDDQV